MLPLAIGGVVLLWEYAGERKRYKYSGGGTRSNRNNRNTRNNKSNRNNKNKKKQQGKEGKKQDDKREDGWAGAKSGRGYEN